MQKERIRRLLERLERVVPWLALAAAAVGLVLVARTQREAIGNVDWSVSWETLALTVLAYTIAPIAQGFSFWLALRFATGTTPLLDAMLVWSRSYVVRYAPTGALAIAYRVSARRRLHASTEQVLAAYAYEHIGALAAGAAACIALFALAGDLPPLLPLTISAVVLILIAAIRPGLAGRALESCTGRFGLHLSTVLSGRQLAAVVGVNALGWLGTGTAVYTLVAALTDASPGFVWLVGSYTAGYLVGFVAPLAPGGLGVREGTLVFMLGPRYGAGIALGISLAIRVINVAGELVAVAAVHLAYAGGSAWNHAKVSLQLRMGPPGFEPGTDGL